MRPGWLRKRKNVPGGGTANPKALRWDLPGGFEACMIWAWLREQGVSMLPSGLMPNRWHDAVREVRLSPPSLEDSVFPTRPPVCHSELASSIASWSPDLASKEQTAQDSLKLPRLIHGSRGKGFHTRLYIVGLIPGLQLKSCVTLDGSLLLPGLYSDNCKGSSHSLPHLRWGAGCKKEWQSAYGRLCKLCALK